MSLIRADPVAVWYEPQSKMVRLEDDKYGSTFTLSDDKVSKYSIRRATFKFIGILLCLYFFICSLDVLSTAFKLLAGKTTGK